MGCIIAALMLIFWQILAVNENPYSWGFAGVSVCCGSMAGRACIALHTCGHLAVDEFEFSVGPSVSSILSGNSMDYDHPRDPKKPRTPSQGKQSPLFSQSFLAPPLEGRTRKDPSDIKSMGVLSAFGGVMFDWLGKER
jgi:hypothetical protein